MVLIPMQKAKMTCNKVSFSSIFSCFSRFFLGNGGANKLIKFQKHQYSHP